ncbi:deoxyribodipyrimidine photolyase [Ornatilinea apprima]|uniref:Deoxyribodipyrimidine photo-lyase n=1 Tax=Ornatilinea apprima TaxID=1134406 RepID=A0A0N8GMB2_9CHLR|nr:deoxyribodipyrimidine photo-lyase [Ornatilinea apprima]KPL74810.1 deoxyribodipyrimidine photolyase [Ornatilinea apprima]
MKTAIWWVRRDLRVEDNPALKAALEVSAEVVPLFIADEGSMRLDAPKRIAFLWNGLRALDGELRKRGSRLIVRSGRPEEVLPAVLAESGAQAVFAEEDYSPYARARDLKVGDTLPLRLSVGLTAQHPVAVVKNDGAPYTVFTPFSKAWKALPQSSPAGLLANTRIHTPQGLFSEPIAAGAEVPGFPAGEEEARRRLEQFLAQKVRDYHDGRNQLDEEGTSRLSPYFRFGMLSARLAAAKMSESARKAASKGAETWLNELIWREFYQAILYHFPGVLKQAFNPALREIAWRDAPADLAAWKAGLTGYPVVDASMRQLAATGWMHNRGRMIAASFLVKDLLINWQEGETWFMHSLIDGDPASNNGGWQWTAGVGTDAAPYFRVFNPVLQGKKFDPRGDFVRAWVPELGRVPEKYIHEPWLMNLQEQSAAGCRVGRDYPAPLVDHSAARERTLEAFRASRLRWEQRQAGEQPETDLPG